MFNSIATILAIVTDDTTHTHLTTLSQLLAVGGVTLYMVSSVTTARIVARLLNIY